MVLESRISDPTVLRAVDARVGVVLVVPSLAVGGRRPVALRNAANSAFVTLWRSIQKSRT
jgi:hypothetical protein